ncbi:MAG: hypothetical protein LBS63_04520 [Prevotellaceae bacterium]|jgi:hypothetical protein|nr:hypothetical protein [Prevotellaceae bacterium]
MEQTHIRIGKDTKVRLQLFQKQHALKTSSEAISAMLQYFSETGDDPAHPTLTAKAQLGEIQKRLNQVVAFIRTFEKENLRPVLSEITKANRQMLSLAPPGGQPLLTQADMREAVSDAVMALFDALKQK